MAPMCSTPLPVLLVWMPTLSGDVPHLRVAPTYKGGAAGKFAMQSTTDDSASGGHFTASATLTANFDADLNPGDENDENGVSIGGAITDFMTGDVSRPNWKVTLTAPGRNSLPSDRSPVQLPLGRQAVPWMARGIGVLTSMVQKMTPCTRRPRLASSTPLSVVNDDIARISGAFAATKQ